jgi:hypothetical protein
MKTLSIIGIGGNHYGRKGRNERGRKKKGELVDSEDEDEGFMVHNKVAGLG